MITQCILLIKDHIMSGNTKHESVIDWTFTFTGRIRQGRVTMSQMINYKISFEHSQPVQYNCTVEQLINQDVWLSRLVLKTKRLVVLNAMEKFSLIFKTTCQFQG